MMMRQLIGYALFVACGAVWGEQAVVESARSIPVAADVDVVVVGGTAEGVAAALAAREAGARVFLAGGFPYLGEDMAGTLELACDPSPRATELEKKLRRSETDYANYAYDYPQGFKILGGWQYHNDYYEKLSTTAFPQNAGDSVLATNVIPVTCTLDAPTEISRVEVLVIENTNPNVEAIAAVDHRGALKPGARGPLTGRVTLTILDGARAGESVELVREAQCAPLGGPAVRDGEPVAVKETGNHIAAAKKVVTYACDLKASLHQVRIDVGLAEGSACQLLSRIHFRRAAALHADANPSPLKVKKTFDAELLRAGVKFLTGAPVTDLLVDQKGDLSGIVIANRSGRQAIRARAVIDATMGRTLAHLDEPQPGPQGEVAFSRIVIAGEPPKADGLVVEELPETFPIAHRRFTRFTRARMGQPLVGRVYRCTMKLTLKDGSYASRAAAELEARARTWVPSTLDAADILQPLPLRPTGDRIREGVARGRAAAQFALARKAFPADDFSGLKVKVIAARPTAADVREPLGGLRPYDQNLKRSVLAQSARKLPVLGTYDTVVVGAGTSGVPAALGAARGGAKTLAVEYLHVMGGVGSEGMILGYYDGNHCGFTQEFKRSTGTIDADLGYYRATETWRRFCRASGVEVWFGAFGEGAYVEKGAVKGVVVVTPYGRGVVLAKNVIDSTGDSDIAAAAGAETVFLGGAKEFALQSAGMAPHRLGRDTVNSDFGYVNDPCAWDMWLFGVRARAGAPDSWDLSQVADSRERRRIVPDYRLEGWDILMERRFPDTLVQAASRQDSHGYLQDDFCYVAETKGPRGKLPANIPLRSFLPRGIANLAVVGVGKGVARDAVPITRMKADLMNEGYAIGLCAAAAARTGTGDFRAIDVKAVQRDLVAKGNLPREVLNWKTDPEITDAELKAAVASLGYGMQGASLVMRESDRALPLLRAAYGEAVKPERRQALALILGILGDATGAELLADMVAGRVKVLPLRKGGAYGGERMNSIGLPLALGRTRAACALPPLLDLLEKVNPVRSTLASVRAVTLSLEALGDPAAAKAIARRLNTPGLTGWSRTKVEELSPLGGYGLNNEMDRCLRELAYARALLACGDWKGRGRAIYEAYSRDPRGTLAEHANAVLKFYNARREK